MERNNAEDYQTRKEKNTQFNAYLPNYIGLPFKEKLHSENKKFSEWLKENAEKYLKKN